MKRTIFILISIFVFQIQQGHAQRKKDIVSEIQDYYKSITTNATYTQKESEVFQVLVAVIQENQYTITRESESRGFIEGNKEYSGFLGVYKNEINAQVNGDEGKLRVSIGIVFYIQETNQDGTKKWKPYNGDKQHISTLYKSIYEKMNGPISLPDALQTKIDDFNKTQKAKNQITKGKDY